MRMFSRPVHRDDFDELASAVDSWLLWRAVVREEGLERSAAGAVFATHARNRAPSPAEPGQQPEAAKALDPSTMHVLPDRP